MRSPDLRMSVSRVLACVMCAAGCAPELPKPNAGIHVRAECPSPASESYFFPEHSLAPDSAETDRRERSDRSPYFRAAEEISLSCGAEPGEAYRVYWGGGYGVPSVIASLVRVGSDWRVSATQFEPWYDRPHFAVARHTQGAVAGHEGPAIARALDAAGFWTTRVWQQDENEGTIWVIEARVDGRYRAVTRVQPDAAFASAAHRLVRLTGMPVPERMKAPD